MKELGRGANAAVYAVVAKNDEDSTNCSLEGQSKGKSHIGDDQYHMLHSSVSKHIQIHKNVCLISTKFKAAGPAGLPGSDVPGSAARSFITTLSSSRSMQAVATAQ